MKPELIDLLNKINKIPESTLLEKIISFCEENDYTPQEVGDILEESEQFKRLLWIDAVKNNQIKDPGLTKKLNSVQTLDIWV